MGGLPIALVIALPVIAVVVILGLVLLLGVAIFGIILRQKNRKGEGEDLSHLVIDGVTTTPVSSAGNGSQYSPPASGSESVSVEMSKIGGVRGPTGLSASGANGGGLDMAGNVTGLAAAGSHSLGDGDGRGEDAARRGRGGDTHLGGGGHAPVGFTLDSFRAATDIEADEEGQAPRRVKPGGLSHEHSVFNADGPVFSINVVESLPPGWEQHLDEKGAAYFANNGTGETSWERPTSAT